MRNRPAALLLLATLGACAAPSATTLERIGGQLRARPFASSTAYEAFLRGELAARRGDFTEADRQLGLATFADESDPWLTARRVQLLVAAGQQARALALARAATHHYPASSAVWLALATALGDGPGAAVERDAALAHAVGLDPEDAEVRATAVRLASRQTSTDAAPARPLGPAVTIDRLAELGAWSRASALLDAAARRRPPDADARLAITVARICRGDEAGSRTAIDALARRPGSVDRTALAWLWLRAGDRRRALEESALAMTEDVAGAAAVRATALALAGEVTASLRVAALVDANDRAPELAPRAPAAWAGRCARSGAVGRAEGSPRGSALVLVTEALAAALDRAGRGPIADALLGHTATRLRALGADGAPARDALRSVTAARLARLNRPSFLGPLDEAETLDGRLARAALGAWDGDARGADDLTAAETDPSLATWASAWRVLSCARSPAGCAGVDVTASEAAVRAAVDEAPVVLRAQAWLTRDAVGLDRAAEVDPRSRWDGWLRAQLAGTGRSSP